jgi:sugar lactone lactonase YvrE
MEWARRVRCPRACFQRPSAGSSSRHVPREDSRSRGERRALLLKPSLWQFAWVLVLPALPLTLIACGSGPKVASLGESPSLVDIAAAKKPLIPVIKTIAGQTFPGYNGDGKTLAKTQLYWPQDVAIDAAGAVYIDDWNNHRIRKASSLTGTVSTVFGQSKLGYDPVNHPTSITFDPQGQVIVSAWHNFSIYRLHPGSPPELVAGNRTQGLSGDGGPANKAQCDFPSSAAYDAAGNLYISDQGNRRVRKVDTQGIITTFAGKGDRDTAGFAGDGGPATQALFDVIRGSDAIPCFKLDVDKGLNRLYVCDTNNNRVRMIDLTTKIITTFAGNGQMGDKGDKGPATAASLNFPTDVAVGPDHCVYIADAHNNVIRRVDPSGVITTVAGIGGVKGFSGDGGAATAAKLNLPEGVYVDRAGNLFIADVINNRIREVTGLPLGGK